MKKMTIGILSLALAGVVTGCSQNTEAQMERTITINDNVQLESSIADSTLPLEHTSISLPEGISTDNYLGFLGQQFYFNKDEGIHVFNVESKMDEKILDGSFYEISNNGKRALSYIDGTSYVIDLENNKKTKIAETDLKEMVSFANDNGTEVFHIFHGADRVVNFELIDVETKAKQSWSTTDRIPNRLMLAAKKADNGIYVIGENRDGGYGLHQLSDDNEVEIIATFDGDLSVDYYDFLTPTSIVFFGMIDGQTGVYLKDLTTDEAKLLVAGGNDKEGQWTPTYKLSPDKTKILFDTPVQVGDEHKTNVYVAEFKDGILTNTARLIENGDLPAIISLSGNWSADSKTAYIATYHKENFTFNTVEKFTFN